MCSGNYVATAIWEGGRMQGGVEGNILLTLCRGSVGRVGGTGKGEKRGEEGGEVSLRESAGNFGAGIGSRYRCRRCSRE